MKRFQPPKMKHLSKRLFSPLSFFILYILVILLFTFVYSEIPEQFYNSNITREKAFNDLSFTVANVFEQSLKDELVNPNKLKLVPFNKGKYSLEIDSFKVESFDVQTNSLYVSAYVADSKPYKYDENETAFMKYIMSYKIILSGDRFLLDDGYVHQSIKLMPISHIYDAVNNKQTNMSIDISECFGGNDWSFVIKYPKSIDDDILNLDRGEQGFAEGIDGNVSRMLYLSMVTITTLGYGDIVPITDEARILIGLESLIGVIIMGLTVNAIFQKWQKN